MFGGKTREEKKEEQLQKFQQRYHIDELDPRDLETVQQIAADLVGNGAMKMGMIFSFSNASDQLKVTYLSALVEQNWILMNQLNRLNKNVERLLNK